MLKSPAGLQSPSSSTRKRTLRPFSSGAPWRRRTTQNARSEPGENRRRPERAARPPGTEPPAGRPVVAERVTIGELNLSPAESVGSGHLPSWAVSVPVVHTEGTPPSFIPPSTTFDYISLMCPWRGGISRTAGRGSRRDALSRIIRGFTPMGDSWGPLCGAAVSAIHLS